MSRNICIDIDGTMSDPYFFIPYLNKLTGKILTKDDYTSIDWNDTYGPEFKDIYENFDDKYTYIYNEVELQEGVKEVIDMLVENGDNVYFVTARSHTIDKITKEWIKSKGLDASKVHSLSGNEGKVETAKKLNCDVFIEDDPNNIENLLKAGFDVIAMESNYNKKLLERLRRCYDNISQDENKPFNKKIKKKLKIAKNWIDIDNILVTK